MKRQMRQSYQDLKMLKDFMCQKSFGIFSTSKILVLQWLDGIAFFLMKGQLKNLHLIKANSEEFSD